MTETITSQSDRLATLFTGIDLSHVNALASRFETLPEGADGLFVWPTHTFLGRHWNIENPYGNSGPVTASLFDLLKTDRDVEVANYLILDNRHHRFEPETLAILRELEANTPGDALVMPASLHYDYYGEHGTRDALWKAAHLNQLPGPDTHGIIALLTSPGRILFTGCPGTQNDCLLQAEWRGWSCLDSNGRHIWLTARWPGEEEDGCGSLFSFLG